MSGLRIIAVWQGDFFDLLLTDRHARFTHLFLANGVGMPNYRLQVRVKGGVGNLTDELLTASDDDAAVAAAKQFPIAVGLGAVDWTILTTADGSVIWELDEPV